MTKPKKPTDPRLAPLAKLLCEQWDDYWGDGWRLHIANAKAILKLIDGVGK
jgi:hypothetical protein